MDHLNVPQVDFILGGYDDGYDFSPRFKSVIMPTLDFDASGILLGVGSVPSTAGQSVSRILSEGFRLWTGSGPPVYCCVFTILSWKLGIGAMSDITFRSWNHSIGSFF